MTDKLYDEIIKSLEFDSASEDDFEQMKRAIDAARADTRRLDWLEKSIEGGCAAGVVRIANLMYCKADLRQAIDEIMKKASK